VWHPASAVSYAIPLGVGVEHDDEREDIVDPRQDSRWRGRAMLLLSLGCVAAGILVASGAILVAAWTTTSPPTGHADRGPVPRTTPVPKPSTAPVSEARGHDAEYGSVSSLVDSEWIEQIAERTGIPSRALAAYAGASMQLAGESPTCGIGWNTLAGIGFVESEHGTIHGSQIDDDGVARPGIVGIPLTGETTLQIRDTDDGELDGDPVWDRAVGPMQFIPSTWSEWGSDGDGDGIRDPQNIDDSALAAARYLCFAGGDLTQPANWIAAIHAYNPSVEYNNRVADAASHYAARG
jgi:membrane-bound lytic murein transglycosylase B